MLTQRIRPGLGQRPGSTFVVGDEGMGKTAFLKHLFAPEVRAGYGLAPSSSLVMAYLALDKGAGTEPERFMALLIDSLRRAVNLEGRDERKPCTPSEFLQTIERIVRSGERTVILVVDDFHLVAENPACTADFLGFLRSVPYNHHCSYVFSTRLEVRELARREDLVTSPFFNIFSTVRMRPLEPPSAETLVMQLLKPAAAETEGVLAQIQGIAGGIPLLLAEGCRIANEGAGRISLLDLVSAMESRVTHFLDRFWARLEPEVREALGHQLSAGESLTTADRDFLRSLIDTGYILREGDWKLRSGLLAWHVGRRLGVEVELRRWITPPSRPRLLWNRVFGEGAR